MKSATIVWTILFVLGGAGLLYRATTTGMGRAYVRAVEVQPENGAPGWKRYDSVPPKMRSEPDVSLSMTRTIGIWVAACFTLCIFSFLYGDNFFYKFAEAVLVGTSAAYAMVIGFWTNIVHNLFGKLFPGLMRQSFIPGLREDQEPELIYIVPLILSVLMLWRLAPKGGWISRWPLAFFIGAMVGIRMIAYMQADFVAQIANTILPLVVLLPSGFDFWSSLKNITIVAGILACLVYFFFSIEHKGVVAKVARVGIWFLMITFGAGFGYTVMGRIVLLAARFEFLFDDWLWLIDPRGTRIGM